MSRTFHQSVEFPGVTARDLFRTYMSSTEHAAAIGAPAVISSHVGGSLRAFGDDGVKGTNLALVPDRMIVQAWRGQPWRARDLDSVLVLIFEDAAAGARIHLTQVNVPDQAYALVNAEAWNEMYWRRWQAYFATRKTSP